MESTIFETFYNFLKNTKFSNVRRDDFLKQINNRIGIDKFNSLSIEAFDELLLLLNDEPQIIVDLIKDLLAENQSITTVINHVFAYPNNENDFNSKFHGIALFYENCELFQLASYLIAKRKSTLHQLSEKEAILKKFRAVGLTPRHVQLIRELRNAKSHKFTIRNGEIIDKDNKPICDLNEMNEVHEMISKITDWWIHQLFNYLYYNPIFLCVTIYSIVDELYHNKNNYVNYINDLATIIPFEKAKKVAKNIELSDVQEDKPPIVAVWITKSWNFIKDPVKSVKKYYLKKIVKNTFSSIQTQLDEHTKAINKDSIALFVNQLRQISSEYCHVMLQHSKRMSNPLDKERMRKMAIIGYKMSTGRIESLNSYVEQVEDYFNQYKKEKNLNNYF